MGIYAFKPLFQTCLRGVERQLIKSAVQPNTITLAAMLVSAAGGVALAFSGHYHLILLCCPPIAFVRTALNALDGMVARSTGRQSAAGEVLNEMSDRIADAFMLGGFAFSGLVNVHLAWLTVVAALLSENISVASKAAGGPRDYSGIMGKADRMILLSIASLLAFAFPKAMWMNLAYLGCLLLCLFTLFQRAFAIAQSLRQVDTAADSSYAPQ